MLGLACLMRIYLKFYLKNLKLTNISVLPIFIHVCKDLHEPLFSIVPLYISSYLICIQNGKKGKRNWTFVMKMEFLWPFCCPKSIVYIFYIRFYSFLSFHLLNTRMRHSKSWLYKILKENNFLNHQSKASIRPFTETTE